MSERYAGVVDTVSGVMLARALAQVKYGGAAAVCGLAGGPAFPGSILPFILRGVSMYGIDSVMLPKAPREEAWRRLGSDLPLDKLDSTVSEAGARRPDRRWAQKSSREKYAAAWSST